MLRAIASALVKCIRRDLAGYGSLKTNNLFLFVGLLIWGALKSGVEPASSYPFLLVLAVLMLFPASGDPLEKIPRVRLGLWPLSRSRRVILRSGSFALSPVFWILTVLIAVRATPGIALGLVMFSAAAWTWRQGTGYRASSPVPRIGLARRPGTAVWPTAVLVTNNLRQMVTVLDTWLVLFIGAG